MVAAPKSYIRRNPELANNHIDSMMHLAETAGCQLMPQVNKPQLLRGLCPFHETQRLHTANTLVVNALTGNFHCQAQTCKVNGTPTTFVALIWGVCHAEAHRILATTDPNDIRLERPTPICMVEPSASARSKYRPQNTNLLTRATDYFAASIITTPAALTYLARLGIPLHTIESTKVGYIKGWGLANYLRQTDTTQAEIEQSPLFGANGRGKLVERFRSAITMPDLDIVKATRWILLIPPNCPEPGQPWPKEPPRPLHLRGQRPYLFGLSNTPRRSPFLTLTDDARIQLVMQAENVPSCHTIYRNDPEKIVDYLISKHPRSLSLMLHDRTLADSLAETFAAKDTDIRVKNMPPDRFLPLLEPSTRDLTPIVGKRRELTLTSEAGC